MSDTKKQKRVKVLKVAKTNAELPKGTVSELLSVLEDVKEFRCTTIARTFGKNPVPPEVARLMEICFKLLSVITHAHPEDRSVPIDPDADYYLCAFTEIAEHVRVLEALVEKIKNEDNMDARTKQNTIDKIRLRIKRAYDLGMIESHEQ